LCAARGAFAIATLKLVCISQKCNYSWNAGVVASLNEPQE